MNFLETRNRLMAELGWNRRVATLATRIRLGVDTWKGIARCPSFYGTPLLYPAEELEIREEMQCWDISI